VAFLLLGLVEMGRWSFKNGVDGAGSNQRWKFDRGEGRGEGKKGVSRDLTKRKGDLWPSLISEVGVEIYDSGLNGCVRFIHSEGREMLWGYNWKTVWNCVAFWIVVRDLGKSLVRS
jgi:hypothetical protein